MSVAMSAIRVMVSKETPVEIVVLKDTKYSSYFEAQTSKKIEEQVEDIPIFFLDVFKNEVEK